MSPIEPEILARTLMPRELLQRADALHLALHLNPHGVKVAVLEQELVWSSVFDVANAQDDDYGAVLRFLSERNWYERVFRKVTITFDTPYYTLVPQGFAIEGKEQELLAFNLPGIHAPAATSHADEAGLQVIYKEEPALLALLRHWPNARFYPSVALFIRFAKLYNSAPSAALVYTSAGAVWLTVFKDGKLQLANHYTMQSADDVLYHLANSAMRLGIDLGTLPITLQGSGNLAAIAEHMSDYCANLTIGEQHFPLLAHRLCV